MYVSDLPWLNQSNGWGPIERDTSNGEAAAGDGRTITIGGTQYDKGIGMHATGALSVDLAANCTSFSAFVGLDDEVTSGVGTTRFQVFGDGRLLAETPVLTGNDGSHELTADVTDVETLRLVAHEATNGKNFDHASWGDARLACADVPPEDPAVVERWAIGAPEGSDLGGELTLDSTGRVGLDISAAGQSVVSATRLGLVGSDGDFRSGLSFVSRTDAVVADSYTMTTGKRAERAYTHTESLFEFQNRDGKRFSIQVRLGADGAAYRYLVDGDGEHRVDDESGRWTLPADGRAWMQKSYAVNYEAEWTQTTASGGNGTGSVGYPALFQQGERYVLLTEADLHGDYSGSHLSHGTGSLSYGVDLFQNRPVTATGDLSTPWRVAIVGGLDDVVSSTLVDDLASPNQLSGTDTSWIRTGTSSWSWLTDWNSPRSEDRQRDFIDLSSRMGWEYVLLDEGWDASWVPRTVRYAQTKGVEVIVWFHSRDLRTQEQRDEWLPRLASWGVRGIKVDFMDTDSQAIHQWYDQIAADTAEHRLMVNFHGASLPTGMQRTWPHIMTYEAVRGAENGISPQRSLTVPFTRNVVGSMDWTPVTFSRGNGSSSKAHEVAMAIVYESGWQHMSDKPEAYAAEPNAAPFLQNIPARWDETRLISGTPGSDLVLARKSADRWFVGGMRAGTGAPLELPLDRFGGRKLIVDLLTDQGSNGSATVAKTVRATSEETLTVPTATNGGFAAVVCLATPHRDSCLDPVEPVPAAQLDVEPARADIAPGTTLDLSATFSVADREVGTVSLSPAVPDGWVLDGDPVRAKQLGAGQVLEGTWRVTVPEDAESGTVELPVRATYRDGGSQHVAANQSTMWVTPPPLTGTVYLSDVPWLEQSNGYGPIERDMSNGQAAAGDGRPLEIDDVRYAKGIGMHATGSLTAWLGGTCTTFGAVVGIDDEVLETPRESGIGSVRFEVYGDGRLLAQTPVLTNDEAALPLNVDVTGIDRLRLVAHEATNGKNFDHADWADARATCG
ncbi:alpha-galactosidase-like protein [Isoptericola variabilis J7]|uniref:Glycoside hydrolase 97 n=1 Tax=Isoptericola variabilis (strain 225) TaxID=743718 RepID=F6FX46_ISOV2|nr:Glycoside hydrolase 97 [Isoptericola variabilis 225]TWH27132.1 alpha-galactosidase-like protein [Isoptericola variabilis J7]